MNYREIREAVQPHVAWAALIPAALGLLGSMSGASSNRKAQDMATGQSALDRARAGAGNPPFQPVAQGIGQMRAQDALRAENEENQRKLQELQTGQRLSDVLGRTASVGMGQGAPPPPAATAMSPAGTPVANLPNVDPSGQYRMSSVPQTTTQGTDWGSIIGAGAQLGSSIAAQRGQAPPPMGSPVRPTQFQPSALQIMQMLQSRGRRY